MVRILMMSAKMATLGLLKIKIFRNKGYDVIPSLHDVLMKFYHVTQIILSMWSCDQSLVTSISIRKGLRVGLGVSLIIWNWH